MSRLDRDDWVKISLLALFAVLAIGLHSAVSDLGDMGASLAEAGTGLKEGGTETAAEIREAFSSAAATAEGLPLVGGDLAASLRETGDRNADALEAEALATGGDLELSGRQGEDTARRLATILSLIAFLIPAALLLAPWLPERLSSSRQT